MGNMCLSNSSGTPWGNGSLPSRGYGEPGISIEENAKKEIAQELGAKVLQIELLGTVVADSGVCGERVNVVSCEIDTPTVNEGYEGIKSFSLYTLPQLKELIKAGEINDGFTLSSIALLIGKDV